MSAAALFFRLRLPDFSGPSGFYGRVARRGFGRGLAAAFFLRATCPVFLFSPFTFPSLFSFPVCTLSGNRSRSVSPGFRIGGRGCSGCACRLPGRRVFTDGLPGGASVVGWLPPVYAAALAVFLGRATSPQTGVCVSRVGCAASPSPWCPFRCSRACRERQVLRVRVSGPNAGGRYRRIQLSSEGLSRKASRRALSSGRIYPSAAATSTSASRLQRLWFVTPASRRRSSPRRIP